MYTDVPDVLWQMASIVYHPSSTAKCNKLKWNRFHKLSENIWRNVLSRRFEISSWLPVIYRYRNLRWNRLQHRVSNGIQSGALYV